MQKRLVLSCLPEPMQQCLPPECPRARRIPNSEESCCQRDVTAGWDETLVVPEDSARTRAHGWAPWCEGPLAGRWPQVGRGWQLGTLPILGCLARWLDVVASAARTQPCGSPDSPQTVIPAVVWQLAFLFIRWSFIPVSPVLAPKGDSCVCDKSTEWTFTH